MQQLDTQLMLALEKDYAISGNSVVIAEWNFNRIIETKVTNISDPNDTLWKYTKDYFPASSITNGFRPNAGMIYGFTGVARPIDSSQYGPGGKRYYLVSKDSPYKYWISPTPSTSVNNQFAPEIIGGVYEIENSSLLIEYTSYVKANKIKITMNTDCLPIDWKISVFCQDINDWEDVSISPEMLAANSDAGKYEFWYDGNGWVENQQLNSSIFRSINKIKVEFNSIDQPDERLHVIEVAAIREMDVTERVQSWNIENSMDDVDYQHPIGQISANDGSIVIDNRDLLFNLKDPTSDDFSLIDGWCEYRKYVKFDMSQYAMNDIHVRVGTMYSNAWQGSTPYEFEVELFDIVKMLQNIKCPAILARDKSIAAIMSIVLDLVGIDRYEFDTDDFDVSGSVKYFWTDGDETVFEVLDRLCKSYQAAIFTDEFGSIQLLTKNQIANENDIADFELRGKESVDVDGNVLLPNIIDLKKSYDFAVNDVDISYTTKEKNIDPLDVTGKVLTSKVWDTSESVVIKSSPLTKDLLEDKIPNESGVRDFDVWIPAKDAETWPYSGFVNVDGEIIKYEGKGYKVFNYSGSVPTYEEKIIKNFDDKKKYDKESYMSFNPVGPNNQGGIIAVGDEYGNSFSGRLAVTERGVKDTEFKDHVSYYKNGWVAFRGWVNSANGTKNPGEYIDPVNLISLEDLADWRNKPNWSNEQRRWTVANSKMVCSRPDVSDPDKMSLFIKNLGDVEFREFSTRIKFTQGGTAGIIFCISNAEGYTDDDPSLEHPALANRYYMLSVSTTESIESAGRTINEVTVQVKDGDEMTNLTPIGLSYEDGAGKVQIDLNKWYDVEIIYHDNIITPGSTVGSNARMEVFIDGQFIMTYTTDDLIRPTNWAGLVARYSTTVEFEYFYAGTTSKRGSARYDRSNAFGMYIRQIPSGSNSTVVENFGQLKSWPGRIALSLASLSEINVSSLKLYTASSSIPIKELGPVKIKPESKNTWILDELTSNKVSFFKMTYTCSSEISLVMESTNIGAIDYYGYRNEAPRDFSYYSSADNGFLSSRLKEFIVNKSGKDLLYSNQQLENFSGNSYFDDFGSFVRELREFDSDLSVFPAEATKVFVSNPQVVEFDSSYNPRKAMFSLLNIGYKDEIANGTEEIDDSNSIDHTLLMYGHIIIEKEEKTKNVKNENSIRRYGQLVSSIDADWISSDKEAEDLAEWISQHWQSPMDTLNLTVFSNVYAQIGDKVKVIYDDAQISPDWLFIVSSISRQFDDSGLSTSLTLRRVR